MELKLNSNIKRIPIVNEHDELICELKIDTADTYFSERFARVVNNLEKCDIEVDAKFKEFNDKYQGQEEITQEMALELARIKIDYLNSIIVEIDALFGKDTVKNVFKEHYDLHEDYIPDEIVLAEFIDQIIPIVAKVTEQRFTSIEKKYNSNRGRKKK